VQLTNDSEKKVYEVDIAGMAFKLLSEQREDLVHEMVDYVDLKIREAMQFSKNASLPGAAVLAALNIAEELFLLKQKARTQLDQLANRTESILLQIEESSSGRD
jgi:cell division protein ZapA